VTTIESKLLKITSQVAQVLKSCNENVKSIQSLNSTVLEFMQQFQSTLATLGNLGLRDHASPLGHNVSHVVENNLTSKEREKLGSKI
jgi:hypothetical protein